MLRSTSSRWIVVAPLALLILGALALVAASRPGGGAQRLPRFAHDGPLARALDRSLRRHAGDAGQQVPPLAIRPLALAAPDAELSAFGEALCRQLAASLARSGALHTAARESTRAALAAGQDDRRLASLLRVDHALTGQAERLPDGRVRSRPGFDGKRSRGARWQVIANNDGSPWLQLTYRNGAVENYKLELRGSSTYLNGARYFRAASEQCR